MADPTIAGAQQGHWASTFAANPNMYGTDPSASAVAAAARFAEAGAHQLLELGAGQGRDTLFFARQGFESVALDYVEDALDAIAAKATAAGSATR